MKILYGQSLQIKRAAIWPTHKPNTAPLYHQQHLTPSYLVKQSAITSLTAEEIRQASIVEAMVEASSYPEPREVAPELAEAIRMRKPSEFDYRMVLACIVGFIIAWRLEPRHDTVIEQLMKITNNKALAEATFRSGIRKRKWRTMKTIWEEVRYA